MLLLEHKIDLTALQDWYNLSARQTELALAYVEQGMLKPAARETGYSPKQARKILHENTAFQLCVRDIVNIMLVDDMVKARAVLREMLDDPDTPGSRKESVARYLWDRAAGTPVQRREGEVKGLDELAAQIGELSDKLGITKPRVVDGIIEPSPDQASESSSAVRGADQVSADLALQSRSAPSSNR